MYLIRSRLSGVPDTISGMFHLYTVSPLPARIACFCLWLLCDPAVNQADFHRRSSAWLIGVKSL